MLSDYANKIIQDIISGIVIEEPKKIISQQPELSFTQALRQIQKLQGTSKISKELKKSRSN